MASLLLRHWRSLSDPRNGRGGAPNWWARGALYLGPAAAGLAAWRWGWDIGDAAGVLSGGFALVAGVLIAAFGQIAAWRMRLDERALAGRVRSEAPARRVVDAAAAHALVGVAASVLATVLAIIVEATANPASGLLVSLVVVSTYVAMILLLIVRTLFVGYEDSTDEAVQFADESLLSEDGDELVPVTARHAAGQGSL